VQRFLHHGAEWLIPIGASPYFFPPDLKESRMTKKKNADEKPYGRSDSARHQVCSKSHPEDALGGHSKESQQVVTVSKK
jgi:hypothetical protein